MDFLSLLKLLMVGEVLAHIDTSSLTCDHTTFRCGNRAQCIPLIFRCDGQTDCYDNSDEMNCGRSTTMSSISSMCDKHTEFTCVNAGCVDYVLMCDGNDDCGDNSDEQYCHVQKSTPQPSTAGYVCNMQTEFICANRKCISTNHMCNGLDDCGDNSDEAYCNKLRPSTNPPMRTTLRTTQASCSIQSEYTCANRKCVSRHSVCNGVNDCVDNSDEAYCSQFKPSTVSPSTRRQPLGWVTVLGRKRKHN